MAGLDSENRQGAAVSIKRQCSAKNRLASKVK